MEIPDVSTDVPTFPDAACRMARLVAAARAGRPPLRAPVAPVVSELGAARAEAPRGAGPDDGGAAALRPAETPAA